MIYIDILAGIALGIALSVAFELYTKSRVKRAARITELKRRQDIMKRQS